MGAGIIVVKWMEDRWKVLALKAAKHVQDQNNGIYDIPKGRIDPGESAWATAVREAYEEASLILGRQEIHSGPKKDKWLSVWLCEIMPFESAVIRPNPDSGVWEHESLEWLSFADMNSGCYSYLKPFIQWAESELENKTTLYTT